jgi:hypothetical protein
LLLLFSNMFGLSVRFLLNYHFAVADLCELGPSNGSLRHSILLCQPDIPCNSLVQPKFRRHTLSIGGQFI